MPIYYGDTLYAIDNLEYEYLIEHVLYEESYCYIHAKEGIGKSVIGQQMKHSLTSHKKFLSIYPVRKPCNALWCLGEKTRKDHMIRVGNMRKVIEIDDSRWAFFENNGLCFDVKEDFEALSHEFRKPALDYDIIFIDTLSNFTAGDLNSNKTASAWSRNVTTIAKEYGASVVAFGHVGKSSFFPEKGGGVVTMNKGESPFGAIQWGGFFDLIYQLQYDKKTRVHKLVKRKDNRGLSTNALTLQMICPQDDREGRLCYIAIPEDGTSLGDKKLQILLFLQQHGGRYIYPDIWKELGLAQSTFHYHAAPLEDSHQIRTERDEIGKTWYLLPEGAIPKKGE